MKNNLFKICVWIITIFAYSNIVLAQVSVNSSSNDVTNSGGSVSYSLGQIAYITHKSSGGLFAEGVQQPFEISNMDVKSQDKNFFLNVAPNPTVDELYLEVINSNSKNLTYQIFDLNSKFISMDTIVSSKTSIKTDKLKSSTYYLVIFDSENKIIQTFKIIKK